MLGHDLTGGFLQHVAAAAADVDIGAELPEGLGHLLAEAGAAAGNEDALSGHQAVLEHQF